jgi:hypothetical protein
MDLTFVVQLLWLAGIVCQATLGVVLLCKRSWRIFPFFSLYFATGFAATILIYVFRHNAAVYNFYSYSVVEASGIVLGFAVVYEIFRIVFSGHPGLRRLATLTFRWVLAILLVIGVVVFAKQASLGFRGVTSALLVLEEAIRIIEVGLLMCLFLLSSAFGLHWRQHVFGIALGLGVFVAVELITVTILGQMGSAVTAVNVVRILGFNTSLLIWIGYLLSPERNAGKPDLPQRSQLEQWNQAVMELIKQ